MDERRSSPRMRVLKSAKIILSDKAPKVECTVRNISETGARLQLSTTYGIPPTFDLILNDTRRHCRVAWMNQTHIGAAFQ